MGFFNCQSRPSLARSENDSKLFYEQVRHRVICAGSADEDARDCARAFINTEVFEPSCRDRARVEMLWPSSPSMWKDMRH